MNKTKIKLFGLLFFFLSSFVNAALINVSFTDNDGPQWTGIVDTDLNSLIIQTWVEGPGAEPWWTPVEAIEFTAYECATFVCTYNDLVGFDIPEHWDGTIGNNWGFLSNLTKDNIAWNEGSFTANSSRLGWGISQINNGDITYGYSSEYDFSYVPWRSDLNRVSHADTVMVLRATEIPTPSTITLFCLALIFLGRFNRNKE